jgi:hypothetical protein
MDVPGLMSDNISVCNIIQNIYNKTSSIVLVSPLISSNDCATMDVPDLMSKDTRTFELVLLYIFCIILHTERCKKNAVTAYQTTFFPIWDCFALLKLLYIYVYSPLEEGSWPIYNVFFSRI